MLGHGVARPFVGYPVARAGYLVEEVAGIYGRCFFRMELQGSREKAGSRVLWLYRAQGMFPRASRPGLKRQLYSAKC